jgi:hypothetical protein|tara:strand:+ start:4649 stop:5071 length:423 start_codon:yes stop_codon:yes gene_type:complete
MPNYPLFITKKQLQILELRGEGLTQDSIAKKLGTSRVNITITEQRARKNILKSKRTIEAYEKLCPIVLYIQKNTDIFEIPQLIFKEADKHGIKVIHDTASLISILRRNVADKISGNKVISTFESQLLRSGKVIIKYENNL